MPKTILFIIAQEGFRDEELFIPKQLCEQAGLKCTVASITTNEARGKLGGKITPDIAVKDIKADDYSLCVVVGGPGSIKLSDYPEVLKKVREFKNKGKKLAAICYGPTVLAKAGLLKGRKISAYQDEISVPILEHGGAVLTSEAVHYEDDLVTAAGPFASEEFGKALINIL